jgi:hypothetical protein
MKIIFKSINAFIIIVGAGVDRSIGKKGFSLWALTPYYVGGPSIPFIFS